MSDLIRGEVIYSSIIAGGSHGLNPRNLDSLIATTYKHKAEVDMIPRKLTEESNTLQSFSDSHSADRRYQYASDVVGDDWTDPRALCDSGPRTQAAAHARPQRIRIGNKELADIYVCIQIDTLPLTVLPMIQ